MAATILIAGLSSTIAQAQELATVTRAKGIILPRFKLDDVSFMEAARQLIAAGKQHDHAQDGVRFLVLTGLETNALSKISLDLTNVTLMEAAERLAQSAGVSITAKPFAFVFHPDPSRQIADSLDLASKAHKDVLLQFVRLGAAPSDRCYKWKTLLEADKNIEETLKRDYVVVSIDMGFDLNQDIDERYGHPTRFSLPFIVVLDSDGKQRTRQTTQQFDEDDHFSGEKVDVFLKHWSSEY